MHTSQLNNQLKSQSFSIVAFVPMSYNLVPLISMLRAAQLNQFLFLRNGAFGAEGVEERLENHGFIQNLLQVCTFYCTMGRSTTAEHESPVSFCVLSLKLLFAFLPFCILHFCILHFCIFHFAFLHFAFSHVYILHSCIFTFCILHFCIIAFCIFAFLHFAFFIFAFH